MLDSHMTTKLQLYAVILFFNLLASNSTYFAGLHFTAWPEHKERMERLVLLR